MLQCTQDKWSSLQGTFRQLTTLTSNIEESH